MAAVGGCLLTGAACTPGDEPAPTPPAPEISVTSPAAPASPALPPPLASPAIPTQPPGPPVAPTPGGTTGAFRSARAEVGPVVWASDVDPNSKAPLVRVESFPASAPVLHAVLPAARLARGTTLTATWSYNGTPLEFPPTQTVADRDEQETWVEFHLAQATGEPWPAGVYAIEIFVDGQSAQRSAVRVG